MKRLLCIFLLMLLSLSFLCSCGAGAGKTATQGKSAAEQGADTTEDADIVFRTQYPVYDESCTYISMVIENNSADAISFGAEWYLEKSVNGQWKKMEFIDDLGFTMPLYMVMPEGHFIENCSLSVFKKPLTDGNYRMVKEIDDAVYTAEFAIGDSHITAEAPHGFTPLALLPRNYSPTDAAADGVVVLGETEVRNLEKIEEFFRYANSLNWQGQLRIAEVTAEGGMILTDVICQTKGTGRIDCITDTTRATRGAGEITTAYYSYFVYAEDSIYLSNSRPEPSADSRKLFPTGTITEEFPNAIARGTFVVEDYWEGLGVPLPYTMSLWSTDGKVNVFVRKDTELGFSAEGWGLMWSLRAENLRDGMRITGLVWEGDDICMVEATLPDGTYYYEFLRVGREGKAEIESVSYTFSAHRYELDENGAIMIPE